MKMVSNRFWKADDSNTSMVRASFHAALTLFVITEASGALSEYIMHRR